MIIEAPVKIHQLIAHKIYHKTSDKAGLYDLESPIDQDLEEILRKQIIDNCNYRYTNSAVFEDKVRGQENFRDICQKLFDDPKNFVEQSQKIAEILFKVSTKNSSESDLVVCVFSEGGNEEGKWLALLKMEPQSGIIQDEKKQHGKKIAILTPVKNVLPTGYLQKCAFIRPFTSKRKKEPDLYVVDLQGGKYGSQKVEVASFFTKGFLQCRIDKSAAELTTSFFRGSHDWLAKKRNKWQNVDIINFEQQVEAAVRGLQVDLTMFPQTAIPDPDEQDEYFEFMRDKKGMTTAIFTPDPTKRDELLRYTWFEGDNNLLLKIETGTINNILKVQKPQGQPYTITITTATWNRKYGK
jgi:hypothetical protein